MYVVYGFFSKKNNSFKENIPAQQQLKFTAQQQLPEIRLLRAL